MPATISSPLYCSELLGRDLELQTLVTAFETVRSGRGQTVIVSGEAGIGKSRLITAFRESIVERDPHVGTYIGYCYVSLSATYAPFEEALGDILRRRPRASANTAASEPLAAEEKLRYFSSIASALQQTAARRPTLIVIEDLQWADVASLELLAYLAQKLHDCRVMVVVSVRIEATEDAEVLTCLANLRRLGAIELLLEGLQPEYLHRLMHIELQGRHTIPLEVRKQIEDAAEGNPLYTEEMLRIVLDRADNAQSAPAIPATIKAVVKQRVRALSSETLELLRFAAVVGRNFNAAFLAELTDRPYPVVLDALENACTQQLIVERDGEPGSFAFRHALIRDALYDELLHEAARAMHNRIAEALRERANAPISELAYHFDAAGDDALAIEYNERAGDEALALLACRDAIRFYRKVLQRSHPAGRARAQLYEKFALALSMEGIFDECVVWHEAAAQEFKAIGDLKATANILTLAAGHLWADSRTVGGLTACSEARELLDNLPVDSLTVQNHIEHARFSITLADVDNALLDVRKTEPFESMLDDLWAARYHEVRGETYAVLDEVSKAIDAFGRAAEIAERAGDVNGLVQIENSLAISAADVGWTDEMIDAHRRALEVTSQSLLPWRVAYTRANAAYSAFLTGDMEKAREYVKSIIAYGIDNSTMRIKASAIGIPIALVLGDADLLTQLTDERAIEEAFRSGETQRIGSIAGAFSAYFRATNRVAEAKQLLERAAERIERVHRCWGFAPEIAAIGELSNAERVLELVRARSTSGQNRAAPAFAALCQAHLERRMESGDATATAALAAERFRELHWPFYEAQAYELAGQMRESIAIYLRMGALGAVRRHQRVTQNGELTERQREVGQLVADGLTNRMISEKLSITENTVENHLSVIYLKLGIRTRSQLASYISRLKE